MDAEIKSHIKSLNIQLSVIKTVSVPRLERIVARLQLLCVLLLVVTGVMAGYLVLR